MEFIILSAILLTILGLLLTFKIAYIKQQKGKNAQKASSGQFLTSIVCAENRSKPIGEFVQFIKDANPTQYSLHKNQNNGN